MRPARATSSSRRGRSSTHGDSTAPRCSAAWTSSVRRSGRQRSSGSRRSCGRTWAYTGRLADGRSWWAPGGPLWQAAEVHGLALLGRHDPFEWSTGLGGVGARRFQDWKAAGQAFRWYAELKTAQRAGQPRLARASLLCHSHVGQVAAYAMARRTWGFRVDVLVTIGTPVRREMTEVYRRAAARVGRWLHVHGDRWRDLWQAVGGGWGPMPAAQVNLHAAGASRRALPDPARLEALGVWSALRGTHRGTPSP